MNNEKICHTCTTKQADVYYNLFLPEEEKRSTILNIIEELKFWKLSLKNDEIPHYICEMCYISFYLYFHFKRECLKAQTKLIHFRDSAQQSADTKRDEFTNLKENDNDNQFLNTKENLFLSSEDDYLNSEEFYNNEEMCKESTMPQSAILSGDSVHNRANESLDNAEEFIERKETRSPTFSSISNYSLSSLEDYWRGAEKRGLLNIGKEKKPKGFRCKYCIGLKPPQLMYFESTSLLDAHISEKHSGSRPYICHLCDSDYTSLNSLSYHIRYKHNNNKKIRSGICHYCGISCSYKTLAKHIQTHEIGDFCCRTCRETFKNISKNEFNNHLEWHNPKFKCSFCSKQFVQIGHLKKHLGTHKEYAKEHVCQFCNKEFAYRYTLNHHISVKHEGKQPFKCKFCYKQFTNCQSQIMHMRRYHDYFLKRGKINWLCKDCGKRCYKESHVCPVVKNNPQST